MNRLHLPDDIEYPRCPNCGQRNYIYDYRYLNGRDGEVVLDWHWNGRRAALYGGQYAKLWTRKGRIYGGPKRRRRSKHPMANTPAPVRVNEKHWKIVRSGPRLLVACAHKFHEPS